MKYILRAVVVIVLVVGVVFGVKYCTGKQDNSAKVTTIISETNILTQNVSVSNSTNQLNNYYNAVSFSVPTNLLNDMQNAFNSISEFLGELYFAKNVESSAVENFENRKESLSNIKTEIESLKTTLSNLNYSNEAIHNVIKNYLNSYNLKLQDYHNEYVSLCLDLANYIKTYVYNDSENYSDLNSVIVSLTAIIGE